MDAVIFNNKIQLISHENSLVTITIRVPALNLQNLRQKTDCSILSKKEVTLTHKHLAGVVYDVCIVVRFSKIKKFLKHSSVYSCGNLTEYATLLGYSKERSLYTALWHECNLLSDSVALYAFGDCRVLTNLIRCNQVYVNAKGQRISLSHNLLNNFGCKRYINFKGTWYSNKKY